MNRKILVVDDCRGSRRLLAEKLCEAGFEVVEAADGAEGAVLAFQSRPDAVVTELRMPTLDGVPLLRG